MLLFWILLTKASLNCQKVGFIRSLTEEGRMARRVQAVLKNNTNEQLDLLTSALSKTDKCTRQWKFPVRGQVKKIIVRQKT